MGSSRSLTIIGLASAAVLGFGVGRLAAPDAGAPAAGGAGTAPGKARPRSESRHDSRSASGRSSADDGSRSEQVRELLIISEIRTLDHDLVSQDLADRILGASREELPLLFREIVRDDDYSYEAMEFLVRRWAQFDAREIIEILKRRQSKNHWPGENGLYFKALAGFELVRTDPEEGLRVFDQCCRESDGPFIGSGPRVDSTHDLAPDFFRRLAAIDLPRGFQAALDSPYPEAALTGTIVAAVESGRGGEMARLLESVPEEEAEWARIVLVDAWVRSAPDAAAEWFRSLPAGLQTELEDNYQEAREYATSSPLDP
jgi:hypothetical protein